MENVLSTLFQTFNLKIGGFGISPSYLQASLIIFLIFLLVFSLARMHRLFIHWSFRGAIVGVLLGFILALIVEGFFIVGGSTILTATLGWKNAPKPISKALDDAKIKLHPLICEENKNPQ